MDLEQISLVSETCVYKRRWWVLAVFCLCGTISTLSWNTWGPIAESIEVVFGWSDGEIALLHMLGSITVTIVVIPGSIIMDTHGLRVSMISTSVLLVFLTAIRCITMERIVFTELAYIGSVLQGFALVMPFSGSPLISAVWFPVEERPTATAIGTFFFYFGLSLSFTIGPLLVPGPIYQLSNSSSNFTTSIQRQLDVVSNMDNLKSGISKVFFIHLGSSILLFMCALLYFPDKPPCPPSITASIQRTDYKKALQNIVKNVPLWLLSLAGAFPISVHGMWISLVDVMLKSIGVSQVHAGWMAFCNNTIGCLAGIIIAKYSTFFHRRRKVFVIIVFVCAGLCTIWFSLVCECVLSYNLPSLYVSCILIGIFISGTYPLFYEMAVEVSYPVGEGVTGGFLTLLQEVVGTIFLFLIALPYMGITWINWAVLCSLCIAIPLLLAFPERYNRSDIDVNADNEQQEH